jgi:hypothetical protein
MTSLELDFFDCLIRSVYHSEDIFIIDHDLDECTLNSCFGISGAFALQPVPAGVYFYADADFSMLHDYLPTAVYDHADSDCKIFYYHMDFIRKK